jgi:hypothetical protein
MRPLLPVACLLLLGGCVATAPAGSGGGVEQLRAQQTPNLRRAGVSEACIAQLPLSTLGQVKGITDTRARTSRDVLQQRQRIRTAVDKVCTDP